MGARNVRGHLQSEGARYLGKLERLESGPLKEYKEVSIELERILDAIISGKKNEGGAKKRASPRPRAIDGTGSTHPEGVSIRKEDIISKLREVREFFCIDFEERKATTIINNLDKGCPASISPGDPDFSNPSLMQAVLVVLKQARDFAKEIWEAEEYTRIDEMLEKYDGLVSRIVAVEQTLAEQERLAGKEIVLRKRAGGAKIGRKELMELFRQEMLGEIKQDKKGEETYFAPEASEYMWEAERVGEAIEFAKDLLATLETGAELIYAERRKPFRVVGVNEESGA
ncbi:hypothetical protein GF415_05410 [Candidatus Micrarchaeota archaeon]|nr:hypothetical protein [Candidatus Micrarchaeota archaeon]